MKKKTTYIIKRDGSTERFNKKKLSNAMYKAHKSVGVKITKQETDRHTDEIINLHGYYNMDDLTIERIQDDVEMFLMDKKYFETAKGYITYRREQEIIRENPWADNDERQDLILQKYLINGETKKDFINRISYGNPKLNKIFRKKEAIFGGRILYAIGREGNITGSNCYVATAPKDSLRDIYRADYEIARTYSYGGGQGMNLSNLRPKGAKVNNTSNTTPGIMVFAEKYSHTTLNTQQENRRGALMLMLNIDHPDVIDFITAKLDLNKINGANISLAISDDFMKAYEADEDWVMRFESPYEIIEKTVKAKDLMALISYSAHSVGDPGVVFIDTVNNYHLLSEYPDVYFNATNPCGEQPLMENGKQVIS